MYILNFKLKIQTFEQNAKKFQGPHYMGLHSLYSVKR